MTYDSPFPGLFDSVGKGAPGREAFTRGSRAEPHKEATKADLAAWFKGFASACKKVRA